MESYGALPTELRVKLTAAKEEDKAMNVRVHLYISGFVQGVFFRSETRAKALRLGVKGWVRNLPDGKVEAVFEGEEEDVKSMVKFCRVGPPGAMVKDVEVIQEKYRGEFNSFEIRYGW